MPCGCSPAASSRFADHRTSPPGEEVRPSLARPHHVRKQPRKLLEETRGACRVPGLARRPVMAEPPRSPKEARRLDRLKHGSRSVRDVRPRAASAPRQRTHRPAPVLGEIAGGTSDEPTVVLSPRGAERLAHGHVWVYRSDVAAPEILAGGEVVRLADERG